MAQDSKHLTVQVEDGITMVTFNEQNILEESSIHQIGQEMTQLIDATSMPKILICFANVQHLSSAALGALITINNKVKARSGQLRLSNIDPQIYEVFVITKLNKLFQIHDTHEQARASFK